jgi:ribose transport system ATP-binding protein
MTPDLNGQDSRGECVLELTGITKTFPGIRALEDVSLRLHAGEVLALVGENGAGKSTLINIITGVYRPDGGRIAVGGRTVDVHSARVAFDCGIAVVHQERNLVPTFSVAENICIDELSSRSGRFVRRTRIKARARKALDLIGLDIDPDSSVEKLSSAQMQMIEIARALAMEARIFVLDEPTASISQNEVTVLLSTISSLKEKGVAVIYVSHKLEEVFQIADTILVLRDGRKVGDSLSPSAITRDDLIVRMVGRKEETRAFPMRVIEGRPVVLEARAIRGRVNVNENSFTLHKGEILGWYGLVGSGRTELARELIGIDPIAHGELIQDGKTITVRSVVEAFERRSIYYISENRKEESLFLIHSVVSNIGIAALRKILGRLGLVSYGKEKQLAERYRRELAIKTPSVDQIVSSLSGGNQQKIGIAKGLVTDPDIIIIDEPTVGIDVRTKAEIHHLIYDLAEAGKSIILITSDMPEMIRLADRILVFRQGTIVAEMKNEKSYDSMSGAIMDRIIVTEKGEAAPTPR